MTVEDGKINTGCPTRVTRSDLCCENLNNRFIRHSCKIYVDCVCSDIRHIGRVVIERELEKSKNNQESNKWCITDDSVYLEFNATHCMDPDAENIYYARMGVWETIMLPFKRLAKRWRGAWNLIRGKEVYFSSDILMDHASARKLAKLIIETIDQIEGSVQ